MPRSSFTQKPTNAGDADRFPKYKLDKGEKSRAWMPEEPWMEWYHRIEAPLVEGGEIVMEVKDTKRGPVEVMKMDWIGSAFCLGETGSPDDPGPLMLAGIDPGNCPVCESAANGTGVAAPQQRFAANIIKYKVRGRGENPYALVTPTSAEILVWAYTARIHGTLYELVTEFGDLRKHDVKLELEDSPGADKYQKLKTLSVILEPAYKDPKVRAYVTDLWKNTENRATDEQLRDACLGRDYPRPVLLDMVRRAERQWRDSERGGSGGGDTGAADAGFNGGLNEGIDALLGDPSADAGRSDTSAQVSGDPWADELADHPGGLDEFASTPASAAERENRAAVAAGAGDPFADETRAGERASRPGTATTSARGDDPLDPTAPGATTTGTSAPAAEKGSRTEPKSAGSAASSSDSAQAKAVEQAADDMFGESGNGSAKPEPAKPATRQRKAKAAELPVDDLGRVSPQDDETRGGQTEAAASEPAKVAAGSGDVIDFDDLFKD